MEKEIIPIFTAMLNTSIKPAINRFVALKALSHLGRVKDSLTHKISFTKHDVVVSLLKHLDFLRKEKDETVRLFLQQYQLTGEDPFYYDRLGTIYERCIDTMVSYAEKGNFVAILEESKKQEH